MSFHVFISQLLLENLFKLPRADSFHVGVRSFDGRYLDCALLDTSLETFQQRSVLYLDTMIEKSYLVLLEPFLPLTTSGAVKPGLIAVFLGEELLATAFANQRSSAVIVESLWWVRVALQRPGRFTIITSV